MLTSATKPPKTDSHGGARSILCWQEKLALLDENVITEFLLQVNCGCIYICSDKIRALGMAAVVKVVCELRTQRSNGR